MNNQLSAIDKERYAGSICTMNTGDRIEASKGIETLIVRAINLDPRKPLQLASVNDVFKDDKDQERDRQLKKKAKDYQLRGRDAFIRESSELLKTYPILPSSDGWRYASIKYRDTGDDLLTCLSQPWESQKSHFLRLEPVTNKDLELLNGRDIRSPIELIIQLNRKSGDWRVFLGHQVQMLCRQGFARWVAKAKEDKWILEPKSNGKWPQTKVEVDGVDIFYQIWRDPNDWNLTKVCCYISPDIAIFNGHFTEPFVV